MIEPFPTNSPAAHFEKEGAMFTDITLTAKDTMVTFDNIDGPTLVVSGGDNEPTIYVEGTVEELRALADEIRHALRGL